MTKRQKKKLFTLLIAALALLLSTQVGSDQSIIKKITNYSNEESSQETQEPPVLVGYYKVTEFVDGDTIAVNMDGSIEKVRFIGVDTPETHKPNSPVQCFGEAAAQFTKDLLAAKAVRLEADPTNSNRDRYNRLLRYVYLPDGTLVNAEIIKQGYGFAYVSFPFTKMEEFKSFEAAARENNLGLWAGCDIKTLSGGREQTNDAQ